MPTPKVPGDPAHPDFPHGEPRGFHRGCRCQPCKAAHTARDKKCRAELREAAPKPSHRVPADPVRERLRELLTYPHGSVPTVAAVTGLDPTVLHHLLQYSERRWVTRATADYVAACDPAAFARHVFLRDPTRAYQQVQSLQANGWRLADLAARGGTTVEAVKVRPKHRITPEREARIAALYADIGDRPGPSQRTAARTRSAGWYPPIFYDDDGRFIPEAVPSTTRTRGTARSMKSDQAQVRFEIIRSLLAGGNFVQTATNLGVSDKRVERTARLVHLRLDASPEVQAKVRAVLRSAVAAATVADSDAFGDLWDATLVAVGEAVAGSGGGPETAVYEDDVA